MDNIFIDIERFVRFTYDNSRLSYKDGDNWESDNLVTANAVKSWRRYEKLSKDSIERVNEKFFNGEKNFIIINIADFILCINMAKDHNRGNDGDAISSTGKKVLMMLLLARISENDFKESKLVVKKDNEDPLYRYLSSFSKSSSKPDKYYYYPGRTVSVSQLDEMVNRYNNRITPAGIRDGLKDLMDRRLVENIVDERLDIKEEDELFKLNFEGCYKFFEKNRIQC